MSADKIMLIESGLNSKSPNFLSSALVISHWDWQSLSQGIKIKIAIALYIFNITFFQYGNITTKCGRKS